MRSVNNPDEFRKNIRLNLFKIIKKEKICSNLEKGIYNCTIDIATEKNIVKKWDNKYFVLIYVERLRTLVFNLKNNSNLLANLQNKKIRAHKIAFMSHHEMNPDRWDILLENKKIRDKNMYNPQLDANTDNFTCRRCKSNRCSYYQLQTRSADEPMTTFVTCIECGNRWKC